ncbi:MAG TPA: histidine--tRNA ligase [Candidatus Omnitrophota bacterium]|nr:histidine--tRNA ligase [Candidatus Omnitrophota bacterium]HPS37383.1 histidine--tRNA ligase [Candidatus Omnitrophota bacterium]
MDDLLPGETEKWQWVEEKARVFFEASGFKEIRTPILEPTELFVRSIGQSSDIVHKEMFSFEDRGQRAMTMRPEMTASVARAVIEKGLLSQAKSLRFYYIGPMFRAERPQAGRKRQFHQVGAEIVNEAAHADFEIISFLYRFLQYAGLKQIQLNLNDLGEEADRVRVLQSLTEYFSGAKQHLCKDCQWRLEKNVLRIFDCKVAECQPVIENAPWEDFFPLSERFKQLANKLEDSGIPFHVSRRLVRGLDYYNGVVFEITAGGLGAQNAVAGGGRYDRLYQDLGGKSTPCTGFSIGLERLLTALESQDPALFEVLKKKKVYLAPLQDAPSILRFCREEAVRLREAGIRIETVPGAFSLSQHLKKANQLGVRFVMIVGPDELQKKVVVVKDLEMKEQTEIATEQVLSHFKKVMHLC